MYLPTRWPADVHHACRLQRREWPSGRGSYPTAETVLRPLCRRDVAPRLFMHMRTTESSTSISLCRHHTRTSRLFWMPASALTVADASAPAGRARALCSGYNSFPVQITSSSQRRGSRINPDLLALYRIRSLPSPPLSTLSHAIHHGRHPHHQHGRVQEGRASPDRVMNRQADPPLARRSTAASPSSSTAGRSGAGRAGSSRPSSRSCRRRTLPSPSTRSTSTQSKTSRRSLASALCVPPRSRRDRKG
jgi:hypothetical protein